MYVAAQDEQPTSCDARRLASDVSHWLGYILWHLKHKQDPVKANSHVKLWIKSLPTTLWLPSPLDPPLLYECLWYSKNFKMVGDPAS